MTNSGTRSNSVVFTQTGGWILFLNTFANSVAKFPITCFHTLVKLVILCAFHFHYICYGSRLYQCKMFTHSRGLVLMQRIVRNKNQQPWIKIKIILFEMVRKGGWWWALTACGQLCWPVWGRVDYPDDMTSVFCSSYNPSNGYSVYFCSQNNKAASKLFISLPNIVVI